jgi:hypothetical protein
MQLKTFTVEGLFNRYDHTIHFPLRAEGSTEPSLVLLCGPNGIGKTTILHMLEGFKRLDFMPFRKVPLRAARLTFSNNMSIQVRPHKRKVGGQNQRCLHVNYGRLQADLHPDHTGALLEKDKETLKSFRKKFFADTASINIQLVATSRLQELYEEHEAREREQLRSAYIEEYEKEVTEVTDVKRRPRGPVLLSDKVSRFVRDAQLNYGRYFFTSQPELFPKIIERLTEEGNGNYSSQDLIKRLREIRELDRIADHYGLLREPWNFEQLKGILTRKGKKSPDQHTLTVLNTYIELLESRAAVGSLLLDRLETFETTANDFLQGKSIHVNAESGFDIQLQNGSSLSEGNLSSGEYHLLYLLVISLTTERRGTVIAIDEPEISMHLEWQRKLVRGILECASKAQPQLIIATHSPDITAEYPDFCVHLNENQK